MLEKWITEIWNYTELISSLSLYPHLQCTSSHHHHDLRKWKCKQKAGCLPGPTPWRRSSWVTPESGRAHWWRPTVCLGSRDLWCLVVCAEVPPWWWKRWRSVGGRTRSSWDLWILEVISVLFAKGVGEGGAGGGGSCAPPPTFKSGGHQWVCAPPPLLGRANVLISLFAHILWLKTHFFQNFLGSLRSPTSINQCFLNFANFKTLE